MKSYKAEVKAQARYLTSEYTDFSLEGLESQDSDSKFLQNIEQTNLQTTDSMEDRKESETERKTYRTVFDQKPNEFLTDAIMKSLANMLGEEAQQCYHGLQEFQDISQTEIPRTHTFTYNHFEILPVVFLSVDRDWENRIKSVYLWQVSRFCPWNPSTKLMQVNLELLTTNLYDQPAFITLMKLVPEPNEEIVAAQLLANGKLLVRSRIGDSHMIMRVFNIVDLYRNARINHTKNTLKINSDPTYIVITHRADNNTTSDWKMTLYVPKTPSDFELLIKDQSIESAQPEFKNIDKSPILTNTIKEVCSVAIEHSSHYSIDEMFSQIDAHAYEDQTIILNTKTLQMIRFNSLQLLVSSLSKIGVVMDKKRIDDSYFIVNSEHQIFKLDLTKELALEALEPIVKLTSEVLLCESNWKITQMINPEASELEDCMIYQQDNRFFALILNGNENKAESLEQVMNCTDVLDKISWDVYLSHEQNEEKKIPVLVCLFQGSMYFYDLITKREQRMIEVFKNHSDTRILCAKAGHAYIHQTDLISSEKIFEVQYPYKLEKLFQDDIHPQTRLLQSSRLVVSTGITEQKIQVSGIKKLIKLARVTSEPFYEDRINQVYFKHPLLRNPEHPKDQSKTYFHTSSAKSKGTAEHKEVDGSVSDKKQDVVQKMNLIKKDVDQAPSHQTAINKSNNALAELRKEISAESSKIWGNNQEDFKQGQERLKKNQMFYHYSDSNVNQKESPSRVSEEYLAAYKNIKDNKKKVKRQQEKEKGKKETWKKYNPDLEL